jgi:choline dehydrogenase-like flavoprotein
VTEREQHFDAVVIGAGACGAITAWQLAAAGHKVLMLEAGPQTADRTQIVGAYAADVKHGSPYKQPNADVFAPTEDTMPGGYYVVGGPRRFKSSYVRRVGGSTWHFLGNTPRFLPADFELHSRYGVAVDWPLRYGDLETHYCTAERYLGVSGDHAEWNDPELGRRSSPFPMSKIWESYSDRLVKSRLGSLVLDGVSIRLRATPQARNSRPYDDRPACAGNSTCVPVCPIQAKYDATVHVKKALLSGAKLRDRSVVERLELDQAASTVGRVHYLTWDGQHHSARGRIVVLAAHAIESARLLLLSGIGNASDQVGRNLMDHLQGAVVALAPENVYPFRGPPTTSGIDVFRDGPFRAEHGAFRLSLGNDGWGRSDRIEDRLKAMIEDQQLLGRALRERVEERFTRLIRFSYSTEMRPLPENRVELADSTDGLGLPRPKISFAIEDYSRDAFAHAKRICAAIFTALDASEIQPLLPNDDGAAEPDRFLGAGHISGTCRMGNDPSSSVVDSWCRSHEHPNLFIVGSSVFPTEGTANPTLTAVALTVRSRTVMERTVAAVPS